MGIVDSRVSSRKTFCLVVWDDSSMAFQSSSAKHHVQHTNDTKLAHLPVQLQVQYNHQNEHARICDEHWVVSENYANWNWLKHRKNNWHHDVANGIQSIPLSNDLTLHLLVSTLSTMMTKDTYSPSPMSQSVHWETCMARPHEHHSDKLDTHGHVSLSRIGDRLCWLHRSWPLVVRWCFLVFVRNLLDLSFGCCCLETEWSCTSIQNLLELVSQLLFLGVHHILVACVLGLFLDRLGYWQINCLPWQCCRWPLWESAEMFLSLLELDLHVLIVWLGGRDSSRAAPPKPWFLRLHALSIVADAPFSHWLHLSMLFGHDPGFLSQHAAIWCCCGCTPSLLCPEMPEHPMAFLSLCTPGADVLPFPA